MQALIVLVMLGWLISLPWTTWLIILGVILVVLAGGGYILFRVSEGVPVLPRRVAIDPRYVAVLKARVVEAETEVENLRAEVERLRSAPSRSDADPQIALYRRVGLSEHAPQWLVAAAQRAYRAKLHPDLHPPSVKAEAEKRFKKMENVFEAIASQRAIC